MYQECDVKLVLELATVIVYIEGKIVSTHVPVPVPVHRTAPCVNLLITIMPAYVAVCVRLY